MSETAMNRSWLVSNRLSDPQVAERTGGDTDVLLYYKAQLEAELADVRRRLAELAGGSSRRV
ncbi:MAG: hypothetical protein AB7N24_20375 [Dehalococcoidia bacterium]